MLYLLIWSYFKVKSSLSRADGSEKRSPRESLSLILPLKKIGNGTKQSSKVEMSGRLPKGDVEASN